MITGAMGIPSPFPWVFPSPREAGRGLGAESPSLRQILALCQRTMTRAIAFPARSSSSEGDFADRRDIALVLQGDRDRYEEIVRRHQGPVAKTLWRFTRDPGRHAELVQETFVQAYMSLDSYRGQAPLEHWLMRIALRAGMAFWRAENRAKALASSPDLGLFTAPKRAADDLEAQEAGRIVHDVLAALPQRHRLVLTLLYLEEKSVAEIAAITGWSMTLVKVQAWRARARLKKELERLGWGRER